MGIAFKQGAHAPGTRIGIVSITDDVPDRVILAADDAPLIGGRNTSATATAQFCIAHLLDNLLRSHLADSFLQGGITASAAISIERTHIRLAALSNKTIRSIKLRHWAASHD